MNRSLEVRSPAKLNLFLHVTGQRPDGYHNLQTLFQLLDWGDDMRFECNGSGVVEVIMPGLDIPAEDNLIARAAAQLPANGQGARISVEKRIPAGGGLGGGSSNVATTLLVLNHLWGCGLSNSELQDIGLQLGADVPVFTAGYSAWAEGVGERLQPVELPPTWYVVITPDVTIGTAEIFSQRELTRDTPPITIAAFFEGTSRNDCEPVARKLYPEVDKALNWLANFGEARMTGTGSTLFVPFPEKAAAEAALAQMPTPWTGVVCRGLNRSPVLDIIAPR